MGSVVTTIFFVEVVTYYDGAKDKHPRGPTSTSSSTTMVAAAGAPDSTPRGPASTSSSTTMVAAAGAPDSTPRGPAIDVFINYDGGRCRSSWQHPQGANNRCLAKNLVLVTSISSARHLPGGHYRQHYYGRQDKVSRKNIP
jgi:hypothetical protein